MIRIKHPDRSLTITSAMAMARRKFLGKTNPQAERSMALVSCLGFLGDAIPAFSIDHHLVRLHGESGRQQLLETAGATFEIKQLVAILAHEKVVMFVAIHFVVRRHPCHLDFSDLTGFNQILEGPINGGESKTGRLGRSSLLQLLRCHRAAKFIEHM